MRPATAAEIRAYFDKALNELSLKGIYIPSCQPYDTETKQALDAVAEAYPNPSSMLIATAKQTLEDQLDGTHARQADERAVAYFRRRVKQA